jgi:hypothetical protein
LRRPEVELSCLDVQLGLVEAVGNGQIRNDVGGCFGTGPAVACFVEPLAGKLGSLQPRLGFVQGRPRVGDLPLQGLLVLRIEALGVLLDGLLRDLAEELGLLVGTLGLLDGDPLVGERVLERG